MKLIRTVTPYMDISIHCGVMATIHITDYAHKLSAPKQLIIVTRGVTCSITQRTEFAFQEKFTLRHFVL